MKTNFCFVWAGSAEDYNVFEKRFAEIKDNVPLFFRCWYDDKKNDEKLIDMANELNNEETLLELKMEHLDNMYIIMNPHKVKQ